MPLPGPVRLAESKSTRLSPKWKAHDEYLKTEEDYGNVSKDNDAEASTGLQIRSTQADDERHLLLSQE